MWKPEHRRAADRRGLRYPSDLSDAEWALVAPLIRPAKRGGRPRTVNVREILNAIFYVLWTGCQWKALSATGICKSSTAHDRCQQWVKAGVFRRLWAAGLLEYDQLKGIDWAWLSMDGAITKAPLGGGKIGAQPHGPRQGRRQTLADDRGRRRARRAGRGRR